MKKLALMILVCLTFGATGVCQSDSNLYAAGSASPLEKPASQSDWHINSSRAVRLTTDAIPDAGVSDTNSAAATTPASPSEIPPTGQSGSGTDSAGGTGNDGQWHFFVSPYLYFPGIHGTVGAFGRDTAFKASAGDLLSNFRFGVMGVGEARRNRFLTNLDLMYMRLGENKAIPFPNLMANTANFTANLFILAPKVGFRLIDEQKFKASFLTGFRYWYFGENLKFTPSRFGLNFSKSQSWVDPLVGGRIEAALAPKVVTIIAGDVGGWGTGSQLEYQVVGLLGYKLKPKISLQGGYRYLYFDYENGGRANTIVKTAMSGVIFGATLNIK
jgi:hypothetical protein